MRQLLSKLPGPAPVRIVVAVAVVLVALLLLALLFDWAGGLLDDGGTIGT